MDTARATIEVPADTPLSTVIPSTFHQTMPLAEFGVCAALSLFLVRGLWREHCAAERSERELTSKLIDNLIKKSTQ